MVSGNTIIEPSGVRAREQNGQARLRHEPLLFYACGSNGGDHYAQPGNTCHVEV